MKRFKYHMASWEAITNPKDFGGLGIINTRRMNNCLLVKWIWRIVNREDSLWCNLLYNKYLKGGGNFFESLGKGGSQFWKGLHKVKHLFKWGAIHNVESGKQTKFWSDVWLGEVPIKISYPELFEISSEPEATVAEVNKEGVWLIYFRRALTSEQMRMWEHLTDRLMEINLTDERDKVSWALEKNRIFSTRSLYRQISFGGVICTKMEEVWRAKLPLKIRIFLWQMFHDKLQSAEQLKKRKWKGDIHCQMCKIVEDVNHIMFRCVCSKYVWSVIKEAFNWKRIPISIEDFSVHWLGKMGGGTQIK